MPSLNQLAARMNNTNTNTTTPSAHPPGVSSARPRLHTSLLARTSSTSVATNSSATSAADSTAVQPPTTRSASPAPSSQRSVSPAGSNRESGDTGVAGGNDLTAEHLERLNLNTSAAGGADAGAGANGRSTTKPTRGYKNVPTLEAITERLRKARALSVDGTEAPPPPVPELKTTDTAAPAPSKEKEHPLQHPWTLYHDTKAKAPFTPAGGTDPATPYVPPSTETGAYEAGLTVVGEFDTVETFCRYFNWLKPPSRLERNSNYHLFKSGIKPMWEDEANANGGKWVLTMKAQPALLDRCWTWLAMALVGEELDEGDEICGAVVSLRSKVDRIQLWTRSKEDVDRINGIGKKLVKLLDISETDGVGLEFQYNTDERPTPQKFLSMQASFPQSSFRSTFSPHASTFNVRNGPSSGASTDGSSGLSATGPASAFDAPAVGRGSGAFGAGGGGAFGGGWRGKK
ncbi:translation initiation factor eIF4e [Ramaria rubella]|nr:translation initiation factor eIF4e [Ramaria rubella]